MPLLGARCISSEQISAVNHKIHRHPNQISLVSINKYNGIVINITCVYILSQEPEYLSIQVKTNWDLNQGLSSRVCLSFSVLKKTDIPNRSHFNLFYFFVYILNSHKKTTAMTDVEKGFIFFALQLFWSNVRVVLRIKEQK